MNNRRVVIPRRNSEHPRFCGFSLMHPAYDRTTQEGWPGAIPNCFDYPGATSPVCSRICSCQSLREPHEATEINKAAATGSIQSTCDHQISTAFSMPWNPVRDQVPYPIFLP